MGRWSEIRDRAAKAYQEGDTTWTDLAATLGMPRRTLADGLRREYGVLELEDIPISMLRDDEDASPVMQKLLERIQPIEQVSTYAVKKVSNQSVVFCLGDLHYGAAFDGDDLFPSYSSDIAADYLRRYFQWMRGIVMQFSPSEVVLVLLGDLVDGTHLRIQHARETDLHLVDQVMDVVEILTQEIASLSGLVSLLKVYAVPGNHARIQQQIGAGHPAENADLMVARFVEKYLENTTVEFEIAKSWYVTGDTVGHRFLVFHGDAVRSPSKLITHLGDYRKLDGTIQYGFCGHYHRENTTSDGNMKLYSNGAFQPTSEYIGRKGMVSSPSQKAVFFNEYGAYGEMTCFLEY